MNNYSILAVGLLTIQSCYSSGSPKPSSAKPSPTQKTIVDEIRKLGGRVEFARGVGRVIRVEVGGLAVKRKGRPITTGDELLARVAQLGELQSLSLVNSNVSDAGLKHVEKLPKLQELVLTSNKITDAGLIRFGRLSLLRNLDLSYNQLSGEGFVHLGKLKNLESLTLRRTELDGSGLAALKELSGLKELEISYNKIDDAGLANVKDLTQLESLVLSSNRFTDVGLEHLQGLTNLRNLQLGSNRIAGDGLIHLKQLRKLQTLSVSSTEVNDVGLAHHEHLTRLAKLNIYATSVTEQAVAKLRQALPTVATSPRIWEDTYPRVNVKEIQFENAGVERKFRSFDSAANRVARMDWDIRPYRNVAFSSESRYLALWCKYKFVSDPGWGRRRGLKRRANHSISLMAYGNRETPSRVRGIELMASWIPQKGWGAHIKYRTYGGNAGEHFNMFLFHDEHDLSWPTGRGHWALELGNSYFTTSLRSGNLRYRVQVSVHGDPRTWVKKTDTPRDSDVAKFLKSKDAFHTEALAEIDKLEQLIGDQIASGEAIIGVMDDKNARSDNPPVEIPLDRNNRPTKEQTEVMIAAGIKEMARRRQLIRDHSAEMYSAIHKAFPLYKCLTDEEE